MSISTRGVLPGTPMALPDTSLLAGRYRGIAELAVGSPCVALLAERLGGTPQYVVITVLPPALIGLGDEARRLRREIAALALTRHPNLVAVYECEPMPDGGLCLVTEWSASPSLASLLRQGPLPLADVLEVVGQCATVFHIGHQLGVRNRAIRLDGILVTRDPNGRLQVKLTDSGSRCRQRRPGQGAWRRVPRGPRSRARAA